MLAMEKVQAYMPQEQYGLWGQGVLYHPNVEDPPNQVLSKCHDQEKQHEE